MTTKAKAAPRVKRAGQGDWPQVVLEAFFGRRLRALDPADRQAQREYLQRGCDIPPLSLEYDHMFDDFMTYVDGSQPDKRIIFETRNLVGNALL